MCTKCRLLTPATMNGKTDQAELVSLRECMTQMFNTIAGLTNLVTSIHSRISDKSKDGIHAKEGGITGDSTVWTLIREEVRELHERKT